MFQFKFAPEKKELIVKTTKKIIQISEGFNFTYSIQGFSKVDEKIIEVVFKGPDNNIFYYDVNKKTVFVNHLGEILLRKKETNNEHFIQKLEITIKNWFKEEKKYYV